MSVPFVDLKTQYPRLKAEIDTYIQRVLDNWQHILDSEVDELERTGYLHTVAKRCMRCANGSDALQIAQMTLGIALVMR